MKKLKRKLNPTMTEPIRVLFVCTGNICRSPMTEAVFAHMVDQSGLNDHIHIDSAGTHDYHVGQRADPRTLRTLREYNVPYDGRARQITRDDLAQYDYILAATDEHIAEIGALGVPKGKLVRILDYAPDQALRDFPDPYYDDTFGRAYELAVLAAKGLLETLRKDHALPTAPESKPSAS
jgi:protein-tyrosine phosphatase